MALTNFDIRDYEGTVKSIARRYVVPGVELDDLIQEGMLAVWRCSLKFDESRGIKFSSYMAKAVHAALRSERNTNKTVIHIPTNVAAESNRMRWIAEQKANKEGREYREPDFVTKHKVKTYSYNVERDSGLFDFEAVLFKDADNKVSDFIEYRSKKVLVNLGEQAVNDSVLDNREWVAIREYYGLGGEDPINMRQVGINQGNISRQRVDQIIKRGLTKLRGYVKNKVKVGDL